MRKTYSDMHRISTWFLQLLALKTETTAGRHAREHNLTAGAAVQVLWRSVPNRRAVLRHA